MATNWTKFTNGANERHRRGRVVRAVRGRSRRDRGDDQGRRGRWLVNACAIDYTASDVGFDTNPSDPLQRIGEAPAAEFER